MSHQEDFDLDDDDNFEASMANGNNASLGSTFGNFHMDKENGSSSFGNSMNPFSDMSMGSGFDSFGHNHMGLQFSQHGGHTHHSEDRRFENDMLGNFDGFSAFDSKEKRKVI